MSDFPQGLRLSRHFERPDRSAVQAVTRYDVQTPLLGESDQGVDNLEKFGCRLMEGAMLDDHRPLLVCDLITNPAVTSRHAQSLNSSNRDLSPGVFSVAMLIEQPVHDCGVGPDRAALDETVRDHLPEIVTVAAFAVPEVDVNLELVQLRGHTGKFSEKAQVALKSSRFR
jgi:hypothetical protein